MPDTSRLKRSAEGLHYAGEHLQYRITGLTSYNLERMRVTLKAQSQHQQTGECLFHIDTIDLYQARARETFAESCAKLFKTSISASLAELGQLIGALEEERIAMKDKDAAPEVPPMSADEEKEALSALKSKDLLQILLDAFDSLGYVGEKVNKLIGTVAVVSRLLADPLALLFLSRPGAGKTSLQNAICKLVPPENLIQYTRLTGQSLFYRDQNALKNKILAIEEEEGMQSAMYSVKTLISSQKLSIATTRADPKSGKLTVDEYLVYGPVVVFLSSTNPAALDDETRQRFLILTIDESKEQTEKILQAQRSKNTLSWYQLTCDESNVTRLHHNMQRLLKSYTVVFPDDLKVFWPFGIMQMRREQGKFISLVKAITLLHQYQRKTGTLARVDGTKMEYVMATQQDIESALSLGKEVFARNVDDVSPTGRNLLRNIVEYVNEKLTLMRETNPATGLHINEVAFTRKEIRLRYGWGEKQVRVNCDHLVELGYLSALAGGNRTAFRYVLLDTGEDDPVFEFRLRELEQAGWEVKGQNGKVKNGKS